MKDYFYKNLGFYIKEKLSIENILKNNIKNEIFRHIILTEKELEIFNNFPKAKLSSLQSIEPIVKNNRALDEFIKHNEIENEERINKMLKFFK